MAIWYHASQLQLGRQQEILEAHLMAKPKCINPSCGRRKSVKRGPDNTFICGHCGCHWDNDPDEGGDWDSRNPAARLERAEQKTRNVNFRFAS